MIRKVPWTKPSKRGHGVSPVNTVSGKITKKHPDMESICQVTPDELQAFSMVKTILSKTVSPDRISYGEAKTYFVITLDNNSFRPICRLYFRKNNKYIGTFNNRKVETRCRVGGVDDILLFSKELIGKVKDYENW